MEAVKREGGKASVANWKADKNLRKAHWRCLDPWVGLFVTSGSQPDCYPCGDVPIPPEKEPLPRAHRLLCNNNSVVGISWYTRDSSQADPWLPCSVIMELFCPITNIYWALTKCLHWARCFMFKVSSSPHKKFLSEAQLSHLTDGEAEARFLGSHSY